MEQNKKIELKTWFLVLNVLLIVGIVLGDICYMSLGGLLIKGLTSGLFTLLGAVNLVYLIVNKNKDLKFPIIMLFGLVFAMLGDIILNIEFVIGAALFAIGHIFYFVAYCFISKFKWVDLLFGAAIFVPAVLFIIFVPLFDFGGTLMEIVCVVYAIIISFMVGKAISNVVASKNLTNILILVGSLLFFFSDLMLLLNVFGSLPKFVDILCLATYYPAECLLAFSILTHKSKQVEVKEALAQTKEK